MKSIYQFTFDILESSILNTLEGKTRLVEQWYNQLQCIFTNNLIKIDDQEMLIYCEGKTTSVREWATFANTIFKKTKPFIMFDQYKINEIRATHNRFQSCGYIQIVFDQIVVDSSQNALGSDNLFPIIDIEHYRDHLVNTLCNFRDQFSYLYKEKYLYSSSDDTFITNEKIYMINPAPIFNCEDIESKSIFYPIKTSNSSNISKVSIDFDVRPKLSKDQYSMFARGIKFTYLINDSNFDDISKHFTSMFILFHRSYTYVSEYRSLYKQIYFLDYISKKVNSAWLKGRAYLMNLNHKNRKDFNTAYFKIMELNTLLDGEITHLKSETNELKSKYLIQYDRVLANVDNYNHDLDKKHEFLLTLLQWPIQIRDRYIISIISYQEPTDLQVKRLKDMFDAKNSSIISEYMNKISIILAIWGIVTFSYSAIFSNLNISNIWL